MAPPLTGKSLIPHQRYAQSVTNGSRATLLACATPPLYIQLRAVAAFPGLMKWERRMWKLKLIGLLMTIVYWAFSLILVYSVMMSIFRYAFGVQLPNPFAIFQGR